VWAAPPAAPGIYGRSAPRVSLTDPADWSLSGSQRPALLAVAVTDGERRELPGERRWRGTRPGSWQRGSPGCGWEGSGLHPPPPPHGHPSPSGPCPHPRHRQPGAGKAWGVPSAMANPLRIASSQDCSLHAVHPPPPPPPPPVARGSGSICLSEARAAAPGPPAPPPRERARTPATPVLRHQRLRPAPGWEEKCSFLQRPAHTRYCLIFMHQNETSA